MFSSTPLNRWGEGLDGEAQAVPGSAPSRLTYVRINQGSVRIDQGGRETRITDTVGSAPFQVLTFSRERRYTANSSRTLRARMKGGRCRTITWGCSKELSSYVSAPLAKSLGGTVTKATCIDPQAAIRHL